MPQLHNLPILKPLRKQLRNNATSAEAILWTILSNRKIGGYKFRRQHSVGRYVIDFYSPELKLAIELDGEPHANAANIDKDETREYFLNKNGITVFRYENRWVFEFPEEISEDILQFAGRKNSTTSPA